MAAWMLWLWLIAVCILLNGMHCEVSRWCGILSLGPGPVLHALLCRGISAVLALTVLEAVAHAVTHMQSCTAVAHGTPPSKLLIL